MENMINFGIDLGTTNSVIAKFVKGEIQVFKNPVDWKDTLPSVVGFRKDRVIVGSKAKEYWEKSPKDVLGTFKRKMGTTESYKIACLKQSKTPIELSAYVLKELKTFVQTGENVEAAVITIPASFDTIQSNATKEAGLQAGFKQVVLLQEPIAASLAYANKIKEKELTNGQWLVYDLGGGTFDVALIKIQDGEMKVLDHEGDNYLGGTDFDQLIVEKIIIPHLEKAGNFSELNNEMQSASGKYNGKYYTCLNKAEQAKIELSAKTSASVEVEIEDEESNELDESITITRSEFESIIKTHIDSTVEMIKRIITRNSLTTKDIQFVLMVGGSTFIPYVRSRVAEMLQIPVNCDIDPTTAVAIGAAYYAGTKQKSFEQEKPKENVALKVKMAYQKATKEMEEIFAAKFEGNIDGLFYRITRADGGFDTGLKTLKSKINEDLPLVQKSFNFFKLAVYDQKNNLITTNAEQIGIAQDTYNIGGQPLPEDICLEVDDEEHSGKTKLALVFQRNDGLPLHKKFTRALNKTVKKGSNDEVITIRVFEGRHDTLPEANKPIGFIQIKGTDLSRDVVKGSDIEITLEMSESRDVIITAYLQMADQEFKHIFVPENRDVPVELLIEQVETLSEKLKHEIHQAEKRNENDTVKSLVTLKKQMVEIQNESYDLTADDVTDKRYQLEDKKRKLAQEIDNATRDKHLQVAKADYLEKKQSAKEISADYGNEQEKEAINGIFSQEPAFLNSNNIIKIREKTGELRSLILMILWHTPHFLQSVFQDLLENSYGSFKDKEQAEILINAGKFALQVENWERLSEVNGGLFNLLPDTVQNEVTTKIGFY
ncbi:MAG: Hsp70 family protein [Methylococcales bacterium]